MMISSQLFNRDIELSDLSFYVVVLENTALYRDVIIAFQNDTIDEVVVFSEDFKPFDFSKKGVFISNPLALDFESRNLGTKVYSYLEQLSETENKSELFDLKEKINKFAESIIMICDYDLDYNPEFETISLLKLLSFHVNWKELSQAEQLVLYLKMAFEYLGIKLFVIHNLHLCFSEEEIKGIYEAISFLQLNILVIECVQPDYILNNEEYIIVDKDLCVIDKG